MNKVYYLIYSNRTQIKNGWGFGDDSCQDIDKLAKRLCFDSYVFQIAGWGSSEVNGTIKPTLRWVYKQFIGYDTCRTMVNQSYRVLLAGDKFCALEFQG